MARALLIQESTPLCTSYSEYLSDRGFDVYTAHGASDALALLPAVKPDVTALDLDSRGDDGFKLIQPICKTGSFCIIVSARDIAEERVRALALGADDYLLKPVNLEELFLRMRNMIARRQGPTNDSKSTIIDIRGIRVDLVTRSILGPDDSPGIELSGTELTLLRTLADEFERIVSKETLNIAIRSDMYSPNTRASDVAISRLRLKLRKNSANLELRSVREAGYLLTRAIGARNSNQES